jgi:two-component system chemotaxis response regulator CheB
MNSPRTIHLNVAELALSLEPAVISTILGSCVSVCLYSPETKIGGMIHYALPSQKYAHLSEEISAGSNDVLRFGDKAIDRLVYELTRLTGLPASKFKAKIVGGGAVVDELKQSSQIGALNVEIAEQELRKRKISIVGRDVGGKVGRKVIFYTDSGRLRVAPLRDAENRPVLRPYPPIFDAPAKAPVRNPVPSKPASTAKSTRNEKKRILIIDDSKTIRALLSRVFAQDPELQVVGSVSTPIGTEELVRKLKPDVITLDIHMPEMDGIEFLEKLYPKIRVPVVVVTSISKEESDTVFKALELGAVDYIQKPKTEELTELGPVFCEKIKAAASVKLRSRRTERAGKKAEPRRTSKSPLDSKTLIAIGASTGGTEALKEVLIRLPKEIPPILIVQHIPPVFSAAFASRLNDLCPFEVKEAEDGDVVKAGRALIAPGGFHMRLKRTPKGDFVTLDQQPPVERHRPSVDVLFRSVAEAIGSKAIGVILTGMGSDGALGLLEMRKKKARTIGQDEESCVVYGMPREAVRLGAVEIVSPLLDIPERLLSLLEAKKAA